MGIFSSLIVDKHSSLLGVDREDQIPVNANHREICKFAYRDDAVYDQLFKRIRRMLNSVDAINRENPST
jgi:hypothetical protein